MTALPHQEIKANECYEILLKYGLVYLMGEVRSGKTLTSILVAEKLPPEFKSVLVVTKKAAISGWNKFISDKLLKNYTITNYEQVRKLKADDYHLVICDEAHNLSKFPKTSQRVDDIQKIAYNKPCIFLSGTPIVETPAGIFNQLSITKYNPFNFKNFYAFHKVYGIPYTKFIAGREIRFYDKTIPSLLTEIDKFSVKMTQQDAGINIKVIDKVHYVELNDRTKQIYNTLQRKRVLKLKSNDGDVDIICDSIMKLRMSLHSVEGGTIKTDNSYIVIGREKIDYILKNFGDNEGIGIMCHFIGERELLNSVFKKAKIYSSNAHAEGVDLSHLNHFIIYSSDYSGAKFIQRRDRISNINGSNTSTVHHILVKNAISEQVYNAVSNKKDFNNAMFVRVDV